MDVKFRLQTALNTLLRLLRLQDLYDVSDIALKANTVWSHPLATDDLLPQNFWCTFYLMFSIIVVIILVF